MCLHKNEQRCAYVCICACLPEQYCNPSTLCVKPMNAENLFIVIVDVHKYTHTYVYVYEYSMHDREYAGSKLVSCNALCRQRDYELKS